MPELTLVLLEHLCDGRLVALVKLTDLFFRGVLHAVDTNGLSNDEMLGLALVRQEAEYSSYRLLVRSLTIYYVLAVEDCICV